LSAAVLRAPSVRLRSGIAAEVERNDLRRLHVRVVVPIDLLLHLLELVREDHRVDPVLPQDLAELRMVEELLHSIHRPQHPAADRSAVLPTYTCPLRHLITPAPRDPRRGPRRGKPEPLRARSPRPLDRTERPEPS